MKDKKRPDEVMHEIESNEFDEALDETAKPDTKSQIIKYGAAWLAIVALFFVANAGIKNYTAAKNQAAYTAGSAYSGGQPAANYSTQPAVQGGTYDAAAGGAGAGGCGSGDGSCGGCGTGAVAGTSANAGAAGTTGSADFKQVEKEAINWYVSQYGDANVTAEVQDFGCHQQINIIKDGKVVKEIRYQNGQFSPLTPW